MQSYVINVRKTPWAGAGACQPLKQDWPMTDRDTHLSMLEAKDIGYSLKITPMGVGG